MRPSYRTIFYACPRYKAINYHDGPLPRYAGHYATTWAILNQETVHGITWHSMERGVDTGDILVQRTFALAAEETAATLNVKCFAAALESFQDLISDLHGKQGVPHKQDPQDRTFFPRNHRPPAAGVLQWDQPAQQIAAVVRALDFGARPNPLACAKLWIDGDIALVGAGANTQSAKNLCSGDGFGDRG